VAEVTRRRYLLFEVALARNKDLRQRMRLKIDTQKCVGCGICAEGCSLGLLAVKNSKTYVKDGCTACGECVNLCICSAISIESDIQSGRGLSQALPNKRLN
jgi:MinD superfamily P-loop ATPase